jgi:hypothetical protein
MNGELQATGESVVIMEVTVLSVNVHTNSDFRSTRRACL